MATINAYHYRDGAEHEYLHDIQTAIDLGYLPIMKTLNWETAEKKAKTVATGEREVRIYHSPRVHIVLVRR